MRDDISEVIAAAIFYIEILMMYPVLVLLMLWSSSMWNAVHADGTESIGGLTQVFIGNISSNMTIAIGYVMDQLVPPYRIGAIQLALQDGQSSGLLPGYRFRLSLRNIRANWYCSGQHHAL